MIWRKVCEFLSILIFPFMPDTAEKIWEQLNMQKKVADSAISDTDLKLQEGMKVNKPEQLFPV